MIRVGTVCSGIEAPVVALRRMGLPFEHVFSCEIDADCRKVIGARFGPKMTFSDIGDVQDVGGLDVLVAGLPCQSFSHMGHRKGFEDNRGNLYVQFCRVLAMTRPEWFVMENVRNLLAHDGGRTFARIMDAVSGCGYEVDHKLLNSSEYGVPQNRERVYMVGRRGAMPLYTWPKPVAIRYTLNKVMGGKCEREMAFTLRVGGRRSGYDNRHNWDEYKVDGAIVGLDVMQACLLQGFPADFYDGIDLSDVAKFKQIGNAMTVDVVGAVMGNLHFFGVRWVNLLGVFTKTVQAAIFGKKV
jgi:DNA (cytosine-5)-methyltransferase 1